VEFYLFIVVILLALAVVGLMVGVANDAVNFLNSAIGSKAASFKVVLIFAAFGVLAGVTFSSGMMEVARKGIFNPQYFYMPELMFIFLATIIAEVLLLDMFNTFGMPTSTTVSIVFGLFGSALGLSMMKTITNGESFDQIFVYLNTPNLVKIVGAILLSIVMAFVVGTIIQFFTRLIFTFSYKKRFRRYGSIWAGAALTSLTLFILLKGTKGATFMTPEMSLWIKHNLGLLAIYLFIGWTVILQFIMWFTKINVLRIIVLIGTFALALAFAANDLVNFIGAPLAGLNAYQAVQGLGDKAFTTPMTMMTGKVSVNTWLLMLAGVIMVTVLTFSKKSRTVTKTTLGLSRQEEGFERFESNALARAIVRMSINVFNFVNKLIPRFVHEWISSRFDETKYEPELDKDGEAPAFDLLRAAVILMVAAALISIATYWHLPLSTTYVTFIVAMAAALPDKAWGRESAVYRVSGVITVIGGWFFTAFSAAALAFIIVLIIYFTELVGIIALLALLIFVMIKTHFVHKKSEEEIKNLEDSGDEELQEDLFTNINKHTSKFIMLVNEALTTAIQSLFKSDLKGLKTAKKTAKKVDRQLNKIIQRVINLAQSDDTDYDERTQTVSRVISFLYNANDKVRNLTQRCYSYVDNNHHELVKIQVEELQDILIDFESLSQDLSSCFIGQKFEHFELIQQKGSELNRKIRRANKNELKRIKNIKTKTRLSVLYLNLLSEIEELNESFMRLSDYIQEIRVITEQNEKPER
jgi:phosphate/sulfate permease